MKLAPHSPRSVAAGSARERVTRDARRGRPARARCHTTLPLTPSQGVSSGSAITDNSYERTRNTWRPFSGQKNIGVATSMYSRLLARGRAPNGGGRRAAPAKIGATAPLPHPVWSGLPTFCQPPLIGVNPILFTVLLRAFSPPFSSSVFPSPRASPFSSPSAPIRPGVCLARPPSLVRRRILSLIWPGGDAITPPRLTGYQYSTSRSCHVRCFPMGLSVWGGPHHDIKSTQV